LNTLVNHFNTCLYEIFGKPFQLLEKFSDDSKQPSPGGPHPPPSASIYHHSESDIRLGFSDHLCHLNHSCPITDMVSPTDPVDHPMTRDRPSNTIQHIDETTIEQLTKRDTLTERVLLHLNTPRRIMARSPIQKYFLPLVSTSHKVELVEENEIIRQEVLPLCNVSPQREAIQRRTLSLCNILRSLSFIPGNDIEFSQHPGLLMILGNILLLHHIHICKNVRAPVDNRKVIENGDMEEVGLHDEAPPTIVEEYWWWSCLDTLRENVFVILANISGQLDISIYPEAISFPLINGLLHWLVCPSSVAIDSLPDSAMVYSLSPQRLVVEALAKMSISEANIDYILATPPLTRLDLVYATLLQFIGQKKHPAVRQFALVLLSNMAQGNEGASRMVGQQKIILPLLLECIESSLMTNNKSRYVSSSSYIDDANSLSLAMLRRAAVTLHCLAKVPVNRISFLPYCNRVLALSMSEALDPSLTSILSDVLYELTRLL
jgi:AT-rich interactive domain-containing protein 1